MDWFAKITDDITFPNDVKFENASAIENYAIVYGHARHHVFGGRCGGGYSTPPEVV